MIVSFGFEFVDASGLTIAAERPQGSLAATGKK
jgi:hypothetical protein